MRKNKGGQSVFGLSFGMIFSIIIIIAIIAVAFYVISFFLGVNACGETGLFYDDLQKKIDEAYGASITQDVFIGRMPSGIEYVCFGNFSLSASGVEDRRILGELRGDLYGREESNVFLYPVKNACDGDLAYRKLNHFKVGEFFCKKVVGGEASVRITKGSRDALVSIGI